MLQIIITTLIYFIVNFNDFLVKSPTAEQQSTKMFLQLKMARTNNYFSLEQTNKQTSKEQINLYTNPVQNVKGVCSKGHSRK